MKIFSTILYTLFIAVVVGIAGLLLGTMLPIPGNIEVKIVKSGSMEPAISTGSLVLVKPAPIYKKGDIITFGKDTKTDIPTTHRIIAVHDNGTFVTKGDANEEQDPNPVSRSEVIGEVMFHIPGAGYVLDFARQPIGFTLLVAIPAGLVIMEELLTIFSETKKWVRRRREDDDDRGTPSLSDLSSHLKRVYAKRRAMDEIKVAMYLRPRIYEAAWWKWKLGFGNDAYKTSTGLTIGLVFLSTLFAGHSGGTISYFQDIEKSLANILSAGEWPDATPEEELIEPLTTFSLVSESDGAVLGESTEETSSDAPPTEEGETESETDTPADDTTEDDTATKEESPAEAPTEAGDANSENSGVTADEPDSSTEDPPADDPEPTPEPEPDPPPAEPEPSEPPPVEPPPSEPSPEEATI